MKIGIAGLGRMGTAMAGRLLGQGQDLVVWNRSEDKSAALAQAGAKVAATPAQLASEADIILTMLTDADAVNAVYLGKDINPVTFDVGLILKDLKTMMAEAQAMGCTLPVAERTLQCFEQAEQEGMGAQDGAMISVRWARQG